MPSFLLKTEPTEYSYDNLEADRRTAWTGVSNAAALGHIRAMRKGDEAFVYHTGDQKCIVGLARILTNAYEDPAQPGRTAAGEPKFAIVDLAPLRRAKTPVTLADIKADERFADFALVRISRLSVMPVPAKLDALLRKRAGL